MFRQNLAMISLLVVVGFAAGCVDQSQLRAQDELREENNGLKEQLRKVESEKDGLTRELKDAAAQVGSAKLDADRWRLKYQAAKDVLPPADTSLPPELLRKFIEIAEAGGPFELGRAGTLKASSDILFDSGKIILKGAGQDALKKIAPKLKEILTDKRVMLRVDGHTDNTPIRFSPWKDNMHLSLMRARAVVAVLVHQGIPGGAMCAAGFGEWHPVAGNATKEGRAQNRRVELSLIAVTPLVP